MKNKRLLLLLPFIALASCNESVSYYPKELDPNTTYDDVYLIMGQSNASGVSQHIYLKDNEPELYQKYTDGNSKILISYDTDERIQKDFVPTKFGFGNTDEFFGPEIGIADVLSQKEATQYIIKATYSGSCLQTQYVNSNGTKFKFYNRFIAFIKEQLEALEKDNKYPRIRGLFWMQGESDSCLGNTKKYQKAEQYFYEYLRHDLNDWIYEYFNFVDAYIYTRGTVWVDPKTINDCKQRFADNNEHCYCIKTNGEDETAIKLYIKSETGEAEDSAHYDSKSMVLLGKAAGQFLLK